MHSERYAAIAEELAACIELSEPLLEEITRRVGAQKEVPTYLKEAYKIFLEEMGVLNKALLSELEQALELHV